MDATPISPPISWNTPVRMLILIVISVLLSSVSFVVGMILVSPDLIQEHLLGRHRRNSEEYMSLPLCALTKFVNYELRRIYWIQNWAKLKTKLKSTPSNTSLTLLIYFLIVEPFTVALMTTAFFFSRNSNIQKLVTNILYFWDWRNGKGSKLARSLWVKNA